VPDPKISAFACGAQQEWAAAMSKGLIDLPPTRLDVAAGKSAANLAEPSLERSLRLLTWLADEKLVLTAVALFWLGARSLAHSEKVKTEADRMLLSVGVAGVLPHIFKRLVARKRPDRTLVHGRRRGIPRSGNAWDSFPSGHAVHVGAIAGPLLRLAQPEVRPAVLAGLIGLAATRVLLLAHYISDVAAGLLIGAGVSAAVTRLRKRKVSARKLGASGGRVRR
jgi:membrane-associated phospholipid phosphatase